MLFYVPTPMGVGGIADLAAVEQIRDGLPAGAVVVNKSTVPVGAAVRTAELLESPSTHSPCTKIRSRPRAEAFRQLRTNLQFVQFVDVDTRARSSS